MPPKRARISAQDEVENIIRFLENQNDESSDNDSEREFSDAENDLHNLCGETGQHNFVSIYIYKKQVMWKI